MCPFRAGIFLNFRLQMVHSTGLSGNGFSELLLVVVLLLLTLDVLFDVFSVVELVVELVVEVLVFEVLLCLNSCSMSWSCCAVNPLLENLILVSPEALEMISGPLTMVSPTMDFSED